MVAAVGIQASAGRPLVTVRQAAQTEHVSAGRGLVAINFPSEAMEATQGEAKVAVEQSSPVEVTQAYVMIAARGRTANPKLRVWTFTLDNHDFYVLRLGDQETLVYDTYSKQWSTYSSGDLAFWRANVGINWLGAGIFPFFEGSNVLVGDDVAGTLYFLNPNYGLDDHPVNDLQTIAFKRRIMAQVPMRGRNTVPCYVIYLTADLGEPAYSLAPVTLYTSDDSGKSFQSQGSFTVETGNYAQVFEWRSLGQIEAPGRLFMIEDDGAFTRIDAMNMNDD